MRVGIAANREGVQLNGVPVSVSGGLSHAPAAFGAYACAGNVGHPDHGARVLGPMSAREFVQTFPGARFSGAERHRRRLAKVATLKKGEVGR